MCCQGRVPFDPAFFIFLLCRSLLLALLPPLVATGLLAGAGRWESAIGALSLFLINIVGINLTGVITFAFKGVRPKNWWEAEKASRAVKKAIAAWVFLLVAMALLIIFAQSIK